MLNFGKSRRMIMFTYIFLFILLQGVHEISGNFICMTWNTQGNLLLLKCKTLYTVKIRFTDMFGNEVVSCPFRYGGCISRLKNITVKRNYVEYETTMIVEGRIDSRINGIWTCQDLSHPEYFDSVNVTSYAAEPEVNLTDEFDTKSEEPMGNLTANEFDTKSEGLDDPTVYISGPQKVNINEEFILICTASRSTGILVTEFVENKEMYTQMRKTSEGCYSSLHGTECSADVCHCTDDKKAYIITHKGYPYMTTLAFKCSIVFESIGRVSSNCRFVTTIEPTVNLDNEFDTKSNGLTNGKLLLYLSIGSGVLIVLIVFVVTRICIGRRRRTLSILETTPTSIKMRQNKCKVGLESNVRTSHYDKIDENNMLKQDNSKNISSDDENRKCNISQYSLDSSDYEVVNTMHKGYTYRNSNQCHSVNKHSEKGGSSDDKSMISDQGNHLVDVYDPFNGYLAPYNLLKRSQTTVQKYESVMIHESDVYSTECNLIKTRPISC